jgi:hypothetical protein
MSGCIIYANAWADASSYSGTIYPNMLPPKFLHNRSCRNTLYRCFAVQKAENTVSPYLLVRQWIGLLELRSREYVGGTVEKRRASKSSGEHHRVKEYSRG